MQEQNEESEWILAQSNERRAFPVRRNRVTGFQLSLFEIFYAMTLAALALSRLVLINWFVVLCLAELLIVFAVVKIVNADNTILGGLTGFSAAMSVALIGTILSGADVSTSGAIVVIASGTGYFAGIAMTELRDDSI